MRTRGELGRFGLTAILLAMLAGDAAMEEDGNCCWTEWIRLVGFGFAEPDLVIMSSFMQGCGVGE